MKDYKKVLAILLAVVLTITMSVPVFAADSTDNSTSKEVKEQAEQIAADIHASAQITTVTQPLLFASGSAPITITEQPQNQSGEVGDLVCFEIAATGTNLKYTWYMNVPLAPNDWYEISSDQSWTLDVEEQYDGLKFYCIVSDNDGNTVKSNTVTLTVISDETGIVIVTQPEDQIGVIGDVVLFLINANGNDLSYTWYVTLPEVPDHAEEICTDQYYAVELQEEFDGISIYCVVTSGEGKSRRSNTVTITVMPNVETQPADTTVTEGDTAVFNVEATGVGLSYQWQYKTSDSSEWKNSSMTGNKTSELKVPATMKRNGQKYRCVVTDHKGMEVTSGEARLTVNESVITIESQPNSITLREGQTASFHVQATGKDLSYQWQYRSTSGGKWKNSGMHGNNTATLTVPATIARDGQQYQCIITDALGKTVITDIVTMNVNEIVLEITSQPRNITVMEGQYAEFAVEATGKDLHYQWQYQSSGTTAWKNSGMTGNNTATLKVPAAKNRNGQKYRCIITDGNGKTATSNAATLTVRAVPLQITAQPSSISVIEGKTAQFSVVATGSNLKYQWQYQSSGTTAWKNSGMTGSTTATLKVPAIMNRNGQKYRCVVTDGGGNSVTSEAATLSVRASITITTQPSDIQSYEGRTAKFYVKATGNGLQYQWQYRSPGSETWKNSGMTGNTTTILSVPVTESRNGQLYRCVITDGDGNRVTSDSARLIVGS